MITLKNLRTIARAKFSDKRNLGDWYNKRLEICEQCPFNSKNKEHLTVKEKAMVVLNAGKPTCVACGCEIAAKASVREEICGLTKLQQVPLWGALPEIVEADFSNLHIENLDSDVVNMVVGDMITFDYGVIRKGAPSTFKMSLRDLENPITSVRAESSCSCTVPTPSKVGDTFFVSVKYNSELVGRINKIVTLRLVRNKKTTSIKLNIIGTVVN